MDRVDQFSTTYGLVLPVVGVALGLALRLMADYTVVRVGGSLTGFEVGDQVPPEADDDDEDVEVDTVVPPPDPGDYEPGPSPPGAGAGRAGSPGRSWSGSRRSASAQW